MPNQRQIRPLGAFLKALREEKIDCILIGMMAAVEQGAPMTTVDYDLWMQLPKRQYLRLHNVVRRQRGTVVAPTLYELEDGTQVNVIFQPDGLQSFAAEYRRSRIGRLAGQSIRILPLSRVIASKQASSREKDLVSLPVLKRTLRLARRLRRRKSSR